ncbi:MAG: thioredoxin family protein [Verrucomicrobiota bacterium]
MRFTYLFLLAGAVAVHADTIHTTSGKTITGRVLTYANGTFDCEDEKQASLRLAAGTIQSIDFEGDGAAATLETRTQGQLKSTIRRYDKAAFNYTDAKGKDLSIPALMVKSANFDGGGGKAVEQVTGADLEKYIAQGKVTIVDFYADWCGPCRMLGPQLEDLTKKDNGVVLRKVNVDNNKQLAAKYGVRGIPHVVVFDKAGKSLGTVVGANIDGVKDLVTKAKGKTS